MSEITAVSEKEFEEQVLKEPLPVLVDFWAPWCGPCRMIAPVLEELAGDYSGKLKILKVNVDENPGLAERFEILGIPTMLLFKGGVQVESFVGVTPRAALAGKIDLHI